MRRVIIKWQLIFIVLGILIITTGCSSTKQLEERIDSLSEEVNSLRNEIEDQQKQSFGSSMESKNKADVNEEALVFSDKIFEETIRNTFQKLSEPITYDDLKDIKQISICYAGGYSYENYVKGEGTQLVNFEYAKDNNGEIVEPVSYEDLKYFTNLEYLYIAIGKEITNIDFISELKNLKCLSLYQLYVKDLDVLKNCENLEYLYITHPSEIDYEFDKGFLDSLPNLKEYEIR